MGELPVMLSVNSYKFTQEAQTFYYSIKSPYSNIVLSNLTRWVSLSQGQHSEFFLSEFYIIIFLSFWELIIDSDIMLKAINIF
ncbi:hypothetical protein NIES2130_19845 [Scytonema sp. HK-05]|nr:hypothetical protein NIES2130_19845 [Scytonema sp. HK-05]